MKLLALLLSGFQVITAASNGGHIAERQNPATPCTSLTAPVVPGATVVSIQTAERRNVTQALGLGAPSIPSAPPLSFCDVNITLTHGTANDSVRIEVWMPLSGWNGRFQGTGGGGFIAGTFGAAMAPEVALGYAAASTDAGLEPPSFDGSSIKFNQQLFTNFATLSVHEMAVVGKAVTEAFYGKPPSFSYWNGCSTGGRQGYMEAQMFPEDFNGILAAAPAINWAKFVPAESWPFVVQTVAGEFVPQCVFNALVQAAITTCDPADGAKDGLISDPESCKFDAQTMVGQAVPCNGTMATITNVQATVYNKITEGPQAPNGTRLWFGLLPGTTLSALGANAPFGLSSTWLQNFVPGGSNFTVPNSVSVQSFADQFSASEAQFGALIGTDNPNLSAFQAAGGKLLTWHGLSDQLIFPDGTFNYKQRVDSLMGTDKVDAFYRVFRAPGVMHCAGGVGPQPTNPLDALVTWVEKGVAPDTLPAAKMTGNSTVTRNLCRLPFTLKYSGSGDINSAQSWTCVAGTNATGTLSQTNSTSSAACTIGCNLGTWDKWAMALYSVTFLWLFL